MRQNKTMATVALICFVIVSVLIFATCATQERVPIPSQVEDKFERDGRCYVEVWVEVTPEEYIGLDIGDEYEIK